MNPRLVLAFALVAVAAALAGCGSFEGSLSMDPVDDAGLADQASYELERDGEPRQSTEAEIARAAIENGSTVTNASRDPTSEGRIYAYGGAYYELSSEVVGEVPGYRGGVRIDYNTTEFDGEAVAYGDLPAVDRRALDPLVTGPHEDRNDGYDFGTSVFYTDDETESSVLIPEQRYDGVVYEGETYRIDVENVREAALDTYRYEPTRVANDESEFAENLTDRYAFDLSGLSDAERAVVDSALNDTYYAESADDEAFGSVADRFRAHEAVSRDDSYGNWIVRYEGQRYWADLEYGGFVTDSGPEVTPPSATPPEEN